MPANLRTRAAEALLAIGGDAVLTSHTALYLYGCHAAEQSPVHVLVPGRRRIRSRPGVAVHHGTIHRRDVENLRGLKLLALEHALAEVLCRSSPSAALRCLDQALAMQPPGHRKRFTETVARCVHARADPRGRLQALNLLRGELLAG